MSVASNESAAAVPVAAPVAIPVKEILPWAILGGLIALMAYYFVGAEGGAMSSLGGMTVHEWVHDARHLLGFPCH
jgi:Probable cobalt transporter subunit (CbtB)